MKTPWNQYSPDLTRSVLDAITGATQGLWTAIPGIVHTVDLVKQTIVAQPAIQGVVTDANGTESMVNLPLLGDVPIVWPRGGGYALTFPIRSGDECLIVFSSRCIDGWWMDGGIQPPEDERYHDLSDGFALFAPTSQPKKLSSVSSESVQLRKDDGSSFISIDKDGKITLSAANIEIKGNVDINGTVTQTGGNLVSNGITLNTHTHISGKEGTPTGPPQ